VSDVILTRSLIVYTDGACSGNPGPGGWAAIVAKPSGQVTELGGKKSQTTNNEMELMATIQALDFLSEDEGEVYVFTDSVYVIRGITQWIWGWKSKGWTNQAGEEVKNKALWQQLLRVVTARKDLGKVHWRFSRGHIGIAGNERCDEIAVAFSQGKWVELYSGSLIKYTVPIYDFPPEEPIPEMKPKVEKKAAFSYLSLLHGKVCRHQDWASCERRVKGQSGAKFKKAESEADEKKILESWGVPSSPIHD
jgi:ribonuclease HI